MNNKQRANTDRETDRETAKQKQKTATSETRTRALELVNGGSLRLSQDLPREGKGSRPGLVSPPVGLGIPFDL